MPRVSGIGLHTGASVSAVCRGAPSGQGIVFRRIDLPGAPVIPARLSEVQSTERRTVLGQGETVVQTVEHLLAAAAALQIDDLTIELDGPEPPIGDGSFAPYLTALEQAGITEQPGDPVVYRVTTPSELSEGDSSYVRRASQGAPTHHHDRMGPPADRPPDRLLRHHRRRVRAASWPRRARSASCARPRRCGLGAWRWVPRSNRPWSSRKTVWSEARFAGPTSSCATRRATSWATWR